MTNTMILVTESANAEEILKSYEDLGFIVSRDKNYLSDNTKNIIFYDERIMSPLFRVDEIYNNLSYDTNNIVLTTDDKLKKDLEEEGWNYVLTW